MNIKSVARAAVTCALVACAAASYASSEGGLDVSHEAVQIRVLYSVALDYGKSAECIRDPQCLLFDIVAFLQNHTSDHMPQQVMQFELYQSSKKEGDFLSLVQDPFEGGQYKELYDGRVARDVKRQVISLLDRHMKLAQGKAASAKVIRLYKCTEAKDCQDILFGSSPSAEMHSGYCAAPNKGCDSRPVSVRRDEMMKYFSIIP